MARRRAENAEDANEMDVEGRSSPADEGMDADDDVDAEEGPPGNGQMSEGEEREGDASEAEDQGAAPVQGQEDQEGLKPEDGGVGGPRGVAGGTLADENLVGVCRPLLQCPVTRTCLSPTSRFCQTADLLLILLCWKKSFV
jgi:hypothetical protein